MADPWAVGPGWETLLPAVLGIYLLVSAVGVWHRKPIKLIKSSRTPDKAICQE